MTEVNTTQLPVMDGGRVCMLALSETKFTMSIIIDRGTSLLLMI